MFEPKHPLVPENSARASDSEAQAGLRALSWSELNARLAAARELRLALEALDGGDAGAAASFDAEIARQVAHLHELPDSNGKNPVNPDHSTNGKRMDGNTGSRHEDRRPSTRGKE